MLYSRILLLFHSLKKFNWRIIALQCYVGFCYTTVQIRYKYTYIPSLLSLPPNSTSHPSRSSQSSRLGSLCCTATSHQPSTLHKIEYICQCYFLHLSHSLPPPLCPQVHSLHLHIHSFPANRFINTIFLNSIYMH